MLEIEPYNLIAELSLNEDSSEPYYLQLKRKIAALIESGKLHSAQGLPAERTLADLLNISRTTVRRCYLELRASGLLSAHGQSGTLVNEVPRISPKLGKLKGFTEEMGELGMVASAQVLSCEVVSDRTIASVFARPSTATFLRLIRLRLADNVPMTRETAWYDLTAAPELIKWDKLGSSYSFLESHCNIKLAWAEQSIEAVISSDEESSAFGLTNNSPCLLLKRKSFTNNNQLIEYVEGTFRGDAYAYRLKLSV